LPALKEGIDCFENHLEKGERIGALAFYWRNWPVDKSYFVGRTIGKRMFVNHGMYLRKAMEEIGYADEDNFHFYHADGDLVLRLNETGYTCQDSPLSFIEHYADANNAVRETNLTKQKQDWAYYLKRWNHLLLSQDGFEGDWVLKPYIDHSNTAEAFRYLYARDSVVKFVKRVLRRIKRGLK
jgi:GT2 family glycosyltransferase